MWMPMYYESWSEKFIIAKWVVIKCFLASFLMKADTTALQLEPSRAILGCQLVANFLFTTYLPLHASVKVSISPDLCKRLLGLCAPPPRNGREAHPHQTSASEQASLQEAGAKLDTHWMEMLLSLMTANALTVSWSLGFLVRSPTRPML